MCWRTMGLTFRGMGELQHTSKKSVASELQHTSKNSVACGQCVVGSSRAERRRWRDGLHNK